MKALLVALLLLPVAAFAAGMISGVIGAPAVVDKLPKQPAQELVEFTVGFDSKVSKSTQTKEARPVIVYCRWRNVSRCTQRLLIKDHDSYHGTLDFPWGIRVRVTDAEGRCITATKSNPDGWYDCSGLMSQLSEIMPGDIISLDPGESVIRKFDVEDVLRGLILFRKADVAPVVDGILDLTKADVPDFSYPAGRSTIEVLFRSVQARNPLTLLVEEKGDLPVKDTSREPAGACAKAEHRNP